MKSPVPFRLLALINLVALTATSLAAGPVPEFRVSRIGIREASATDFVRVTIDQTFQSNFRFGQGHDGTNRANNNTNTWHYELLYSHRFALNDRWNLRLGLDLERNDFGDNRSFAPNTLQSYAGVFGLEYVPDKHTRLFVDSHPGIYLVHELRAERFEAPTNIGGVFPLVDDKLYFAAGISLAFLRSYPVLPIGGFLWHINDRWDLEACLPNPRIFFKATDKLQFFAGGELVGGAYRTDGETDPRRDESVVTYYEVRAGAGVIFTGWKGLAAGLDCGWAFDRKFDFHRVPAIAATHGAPYARVIFSAAF